MPSGIGSWRRRENSGRFVGGRLREEEADKPNFGRSPLATDESYFATSDSQSCRTTNAELSPGAIDGITKRLPSADTSKETTE